MPDRIPPEIPPSTRRLLEAGGVEHVDLYAGPRLSRPESGDLKAELAEARRLLREYGSCDPYTGEPYDEVLRFLGA